MQNNITTQNYSATVPLNPDDYWRLDHDTVMMILENYHDLATGAQPGSTSNDAGNPESQRVNSSYHAPFENSCCLSAEVARRVRLCGLDGMICEERYGLNLMAKPRTVEQIAEARRLDVALIVQRIHKVTWFCVGRNLRPESYEDWKQGKRYRRK